MLKVNLKVPLIIFNSLFLFLVISCANNDMAKEVEEEEYFIEHNSNWFKVSHLNANIYIIEEPKSSQKNVSYLIIGTDTAIMFDTGSGENETKNGYKIKHLISDLTNLPTKLILSHFHFDHTQNISEFNGVSFPDLSLLQQNITDVNNYNFTSKDLFLGTYPVKVKVNEWLPLNTDIDLGNRIIQLINTPGHSPESIAIIDKTNKIALLGDFLYNGALFLFHNNDIAVYKKSVDLLMSILDSKYKLYGAHGTPYVKYSQLKKLQNFLLCIEDKTCIASESKMLGNEVLIYEYQRMQIVIFQ